MANATSTQLQQLYVAYFGRPADPTGLSYWTEAGTSTAEFAASMYAQPEFQEANANKSVLNQVNQLYINLFGRNGDVDGLQYWTNAITAGDIELAEIGIYLINPEATSEADQAVLDAKTAAAIAYTEEINNNVENVGKRSKEVSVKIELHKVTPYKILWTGEKKFTHKGQEETFVRFTIDKFGEQIGSFEYEEKKFVVPYIRSGISAPDIVEDEPAGSAPIEERVNEGDASHRGF